MKKREMIGKSILFGFAIAIVFAFATIALMPQPFGISFLTWPASFMIPIVGPLVPSTFVNWLLPDGGPGAGVLLVMGCAWLFWVVLFGVIAFLFFTIRSKSILRQGAKKSMR